MPRFSIIIAAYNVADYLDGCLEGVCAQTYTDFEAIVVDDASTDGTSEICSKFAKRDARIKVIRHEENLGRHLTRKTGVEAARGEWSFFLDGDDELSPSMCSDLAEQVLFAPADILHFGLTVVGDNGIMKDECEAFEAFNNADSAAAEGLDIVRNIFDPVCGYQVDWRVTQRLMRTTLLQRAFGIMADYRLERSEDGYECFVVSALAQSYRPVKQCRGYIYHYGRGVTGTSPIGADRYRVFCEQFKACFDAAQEFAKRYPDLRLSECVEGFKRKGTELLGNDWIRRVHDDEKELAAVEMAKRFGSSTAAREVWRAVRDLAWGNLQAAYVSGPLDRAQRWNRIAEGLGLTGGCDGDTRCATMRVQAESALGLLQDHATLLMGKDEPLRIFVSAHKDVQRFDGKVLQPVQVGAAQAGWRFPWAWQDDDGENVSSLNPQYCELTAQYWAWKNVDAEYYGFCHYRRYFDFSDTVHRENDWGEVMAGAIDADAQREFGLDDETIARVVRGYDVVTTQRKDLRRFPEDFATPREHWRAAPLLRADDLERMAAIVKDACPDYSPDVDAFMEGNFACFCNMFIMRKAIFRDYCAWLFPLLERWCAETDMGLYGVEAQRTPGHLAERLLNVYLLHHERIGSGWKTKELQCVHFEETDPVYYTVQPLDLEQEVRPVIPVVFAADEAYVPMLATTIASMMENASHDRYYDVVVLHHDISGASQATMQRFFAARYDNVSLRFHSVWRVIGEYNLSTNNEHISIETYYRFLVQQVLPHYDKVLYLDSDLVVQGDVAELFDMELGDNFIAAAHDVDYMGNLNMSDGIRMDYTKRVLGMGNPYGYFQAGVLVLNTAQMRASFTIEQWLDFAATPGLVYDDQDVLNACCEGSVVYLPAEWNVMHDSYDRVNSVFAVAPVEVYRSYMDARQNPKIIHYAGGIKPWNSLDCEWADIYWDYARITPFYELLLKKFVLSGKSSQSTSQRVVSLARSVADHEAVRKIIDGVLPAGSSRREKVRSTVYALQRR